MNSKNHPEPLQPTPLPQHPWQCVTSDLFEYKKLFVLVVDYYSRYIEGVKLHTTTSNAVIQALKSIFARHGVPALVRSDNGPQYSSNEFKIFAQDYGFEHSTSSPGHASGNGEAEHVVRTVKQLFRGSDDPYTALLNHRATPLANGYSPSALLMARKLRTKLPHLLKIWPPKCQIWAKSGCSRRIARVARRLTLTNVMQLGHSHCSRLGQKLTSPTDSRLAILSDSPPSSHMKSRHHQDSTAKIKCRSINCPLPSYHIPLVLKCQKLHQLHQIPKLQTSQLLGDQAGQSLKRLNIGIPKIKWVYAERCP